MMTDLDDWHASEISRRKSNVLMAMGCRKNWRHIEDRAEYAEDNTQELNHTHTGVCLNQQGRVDDWAAMAWWRSAARRI